nr:molybdopterin cofactor-binding domain-containing protein [Microbulbifer sp. GX H0434]
MIEVSEHGAVLIRVFKQEMGQGAQTGIAMIAAEELEADWNAVQVRRLDFSREIEGYAEEWGRFGTGGSYSVESEWTLMRTAGASAREMLRRAAAARWRVDIRDCIARNGFVIHRPSGRRLGYGELAAAAARQPVPADPPLKHPDDYSIIGRSHPGLENRAIVRGTLRYSIDESLPDMLHAVLVRPPVRGSRPLSFDARECRKLAGIESVFAVEPTARDAMFDKGIPGGIAIVGHSTWACLKARRLLDVEWSPVEGGDSESLYRIFDELREIPDVERQTAGRQLAGFDGAERVIEAAYQNPYMAHGLMEPLCAIADFSDRKHLQIWAGTQSPQYSAHQLAANFAIDKAAITIHNYRMGGGYGRRYFCDFLIEAAAISRALGRKVKLTWTREDEIRFGAYHPLRRDHYRAALDADGNIDSLALSSISTHEWGGGEMTYFYGFNHLHVNSHHYRDSPVQWGSWRSVVKHQDTFSREIFIDEIARAVGADPIDYRIAQTRRPAPDDYRSSHNDSLEAQLPQLKRLQVRVLEAVAELSQWRRPRPKNTGLGVAVSAYHDRSFCAQVVEVECGETGYRVVRVYVVADCGLIVNPNLVRGQIESSVLWGLTPVLYGGIDVVGGAVRQSNFHDMPLATMVDCPEMRIELHDFEGRPPAGVGEFAVVPVAPAISNAIFSATGRRLRGFPMQLP